VAIGSIAGIKRAQIQRVDGLNDKPREMALRQPLAQARRQQQLLLAITRDEVLRHHEMVLTTADRPGRDRVSIPKPMPQPLAFNDIVIVRDTPATRRDAVAGLRGIVAGISRSDETGEVGAYAVWLPTFEEVWMFDISQLDPTGESDPNGIPMSGESIRVNQHGELIGETER
jgi:hypothetical protein